MAYLSIRNWARYQHYKDRRPPWIKFYVDILDDEELHDLPAWTQLLWDRLLLVAARKDNVIPNDSEWICSKTGIPAEACREGVDQLLKGRWLLETRTKRRASKSASKDASESDSTRQKAEAETELPTGSSSSSPQDGSAVFDLSERLTPAVDLDDERFFEANRLLNLCTDKDPETSGIVYAYARQLPVASIVKVRESLERKNGRVRKRTAYAVGALKDEIKERGAA